MGKSGKFGNQEDPSDAKSGYPLLCGVSDECKEHFLETKRLSMKVDSALQSISLMREDTKNLQALTFIAKAIENITNPGGVIDGTGTLNRKKRFALFSGSSLYVFAILILSLALLVKELGAAPTSLQVSPSGFQFQTKPEQ